MGNFESVPVSNHYKERYKQRVANSKRIEHFATIAYYAGEDIGEVGDARLRKFIKSVTRDYGYRCVIKIFQGFVHVFEPESKLAITVYKAPRF